MSAPQQTAFNEIFVRHNGEWCRLLWQVQNAEKNCYQMVIISSYGNWAHQWYTGGNDFPKWLAGVGCGYTGKKLIDYDQLCVLDVEASFGALKNHVLELRRDGSIDKDKARECFDEIQYTDEDKYGFWHMCRELDLEDLSYLAEYKMCNEWRGFWERLWVPAVVPALLSVDGEVAA